MKHEIIKTDNYLLVVDGNPKNGEYSLLGLGYDKKTIKKIIAHLPLNDAPILEGVPLLPPLEVKDDAETHIEFMKSAGVHDDDIKNWVKGYNKARETYKFTDEDMKRCFEVGQAHGSLYKGDNFYRFIQSLSQPDMPTHFEASGVVETYTGDYNPVMLGTYIYKGGEQ